MRKLFFFPFAWRYEDTPSHIRLFSLLSWIVICPVTCLAVSLTTPSHPESSRVSSAPKQTLTAIFLLTNSPTPSDTPTDTPTPSDTFTPTDTYTPSDTPTDTLTPTDTRTPTDTYTPSKTFTPTKTYTATKTFTPTLSPTPDPVEKISKTLYVTNQTVNIRSCASTTCTILGTLRYGDSIKATGVYEDEWYRFEYKDEDGWVHYTLVSASRPATVAPRPTSRPATRQPASTSRPAPTTPPQTASDCPCNQGDTLNCTSFSTHAEAQACFNKCMAETGRDVHGLDDGDGDSCESLP